MKLTVDGISYKNGRIEKFYNWKDVGVFHSSVMTLRTSSVKYICAYTDALHDVLLKDDYNHVVDHNNAEIVIDVSKICSLSLTLEQLVFEINHWRDKYGSPECNADHYTKLEQQELIETVHADRGFKKFLWFVFLFISVIIIYFVKINS